MKEYIIKIRTNGEFCDYDCNSFECRESIVRCRYFNKVLYAVYGKMEDGFPLIATFRRCGKCKFFTGEEHNYSEDTF